MTRSTFRASVVRTRRTDRVSGVKPSDLVLGSRTPAPIAAARDAKAIPYCLDVWGRRSLIVEDVDTAALEAAPFAYLYLRRTARCVLSVPWEIEITGNDARLADPILVFSPGRVGSTLLSNVLSEAGISNISEPDFYTQATYVSLTSSFNPLRGAVQRATRDLSRTLVKALAPTGPLVVKLRSDCNRAPWALVPKDRRTRTLYMSRGFEAWAASTVRNFRANPRFAVWKYLMSLRCYEWLTQNSSCHLIRYEDLLEGPAQTAGRLGEFLGSTIAADSVARAMKKDSQEGTPLAQGVRAPKRAWAETLEKSIALWNTDRVRRVRATLPAAAGADP
jgi:hypothetical protein